MPTLGEMLTYLRAKYPEPTVPILRPPCSYGFIELTHEDWLKAVDQLEQLFIRVQMGEKATELEKIGIQMLLGYDYQYFLGTNPQSEG